MMVNGGTFKCCICGKEVTGWGNDPYPVVTDADAICCDSCNMKKVIPARLDIIYGRKEDDESGKCE